MGKLLVSQPLEVPPPITKLLYQQDGEEEVIPGQKEPWGGKRTASVGVLRGSEDKREEPKRKTGREQQLQDQVDYSFILLKRPCKHPHRPQSHSVDLIFAPWFENFSGLTLVPNRSLDIQLSESLKKIEVCNLSFSVRQLLVPKMTKCWPF